MKKLSDKKYNEFRVELKNSTRFYGFSEKEKADDYANQLRSYVGKCFNEENNWIGYYVPR